MQSTSSSARTIMKAPEVRPEPKTPKKPRKSIGLNLPTGKTQKLIILVLLIACAFLFTQYQDAQKKLHPAVEVKKQTTTLVGRVGKLVILPTDETPTIVTVLHADKLKTQTFFADAKDGDKVIVYNIKKRAILYRPSTNKIVNIAPINVSPTGTTNITTQ